MTNPKDEAKALTLRERWEEMVRERNMQHLYAGRSGAEEFVALDLLQQLDAKDAQLAEERAKVKELESQARRFYHADGTFEELDAEEVIRRRKEAAAQLASAQAAEAQVRGTCEWSEDSSDQIWNSSCGSAWSFIEGGPIENEIVYCQKCGGKVTILNHADGEK